MGNQQTYRDLARMRRWPWKFEDVVRERFVHDDESCLYIALVRAYKLPQGVHDRFAKCRFIALVRAYKLPQRWTFPVFEKLRWLSLMRLHAILG